MKKFIWLFCFITTTAYGQHTFKARIIDADTKAPLPGATAQISTNKGAIANAEGYLEIVDIDANTIKVTVSYVGYERFVKTFVLPLRDTIIIGMEHEHDHDHEEAIVVTSNRTSRTIDEIPTRIEVLAAEELEEKSFMRSNNIAMLLRESTGIQMQITSASAANQSIRIQGLDGRHTQLLRDGFPIYGGFSSGLSIMQIPPLDLQQVEVIKGSNSTLFGGGAIAGLVNLVSIRPEEEHKIKLMLDQTNAGGTTLNGFYAEKWKRFGMTLYTSSNWQEAYDPNDDGFSDLPRIRSLTFNPSFYFYLNEDDFLRVTLNNTIEDRDGGFISAIENGSNEFQEINRSLRHSYQITYQNKINERLQFTTKHSLNYMDRELTIPTNFFAGQQWSTFTEFSFRNQLENENSWIYGLNIYSDSFNETVLSTVDLTRDYDFLTVGAFVQNTTQLSQRMSLESGLRVDSERDFGAFFLPRASLLTRINEKWSARLGGGMGYRLPTVFTEEAESIAYQGVMPIDIQNIEAEKSIGGNLDVNYKTALGEKWTFSLNQLFFHTRLNNSLVFRQTGVDEYTFENADGPVNSLGFETNLKLTYRDFKLFANYALIDTELRFDNLNQQKPLTPKHNLGLVLIYEEHGKWRVGFEAYYKGEQFRNDFSRTDDYWIAGFMAMRKWNNFALYVNFENFTDTRQHKLEAFDIYDHISPNMPDIWAPTDGFIVNGGLILEF